MYYTIKRNLTLLFYWFAFVLRSGCVHCKLLANTIIMYFSVKRHFLLFYWFAFVNAVKQVHVP